MTSTESINASCEPMDVEHTPVDKIQKSFRVVYRDILDFINNRPDLYPTNNPRVRKLLTKQALAIAAVKTCKTFVDYQKALSPWYTVSASSFSRYRQMVIEEESSLEDLFSPEGRPLIYTSYVDKKFMEWLSSDDTVTVDKIYPIMIDKFKVLYGETYGAEERDQLSDTGVCRHLLDVLKDNGYRMRTPQVVDAKRCIKYDVLRDWYSDRLIHEALFNKDTRLVFNADETEVNRKASFQGKVAWNGKKAPRIAAKDRSGSHVSLFIIISGTGLVKPSFLLHAGPEAFVSQPSLFEEDIVCIKTAKGYMEKWTFKNIMIHHFIPYVQELRQKLCTDERAVLIVDGHLSRYDLETFEVLHNAGIDLIILPAHSSHITQPLDRTLNGLIKRAFPGFYRKGVPPSVLEDIKRRNESGIQYQSKQKVFAKPPELCASPVRRGRSENDADMNNPPCKRRRSKSNVKGGTVGDRTTDSEKTSKRRKTTQKKSRTVTESGTAKATKTSNSRKVNQRRPRRVTQPSYSAMERLCTVWAVINSLSVLNRGNINSAWKASGLHPFNGVPPVTEDECNKMLKEMFVCENLGVEPRPRTSKSILIIGLVNNEEGLERFRKLLQDKDLKPRKYRGRYDNGTSRIEIATENEDVGDYIDLDTDCETDTDTDGSHIYGNSNAECYVAMKKRRRRNFGRGGLPSGRHITLQALMRRRLRHNHRRRRRHSI